MSCFRKMILSKLVWVFIILYNKFRKLMMNGKGFGFGIICMISSFRKMTYVLNIGFMILHMDALLSSI